MPGHSISRYLPRELMDREEKMERVKDEVHMAEG